MPMTFGILLVVIRGRILDLWLDLADAGLDVLLLAGAVNDRRTILVDRDALGAGQHIERDLFEFDADVFGDQSAPRHGSDVFEHSFPPVAEARRLDRRHLQAAAQFVDDQRGQRLTLDVLGDDKQRLAGLHNCFQQWQQGLQRGSFSSR